MLVSIIVPNYNHGDYLEQRIESILNQTFQDFELIILDDCSLDNSINIIEKYRHNEKVSHIILNKVNSGSPFAQWEKGLRVAKGKWIWIAESDDIADIRFLEKLIDVSEDVVISYSASMIIDKDGKIRDRYIPSKNIAKRDWISDFTIEGNEEIKKHLFFEPSIPNASAVLFRSDAVDFNIFKEIRNMKFAGDWLFWIKQANKGKISYSGRILSYFRSHPDTTRNNKSKDIENIRFEEYFKVLNYTKQKYNIKWNVRKHLWIIDQFVNKYLYVGISFKAIEWFPLSYKAVVIMKIIRIKFFSKK